MKELEIDKLEARVKACDCREKVLQDYISLRIKVIESRVTSGKDWEAYGEAWEALKKLKH